MDERTLGRAALLEQAARAFGSQPEHLWARTPTYAILRKAGSGKWYAAFMDLPRRTLGLPGEGGIEVVNLKCGPLMTGSLLSRPGYLPAYHINKTAWISVLLDGSLPFDEVWELVCLSHSLVR